MNSQTAEPLQTESLSFQAYCYLRRALMNGRYAPGEKIKLKEVTEELGISQTPIREALFMLVSEHALTQVDRRSVRVPIILADQYREIRDLRMMLEGDAAERAANNATREEISRLTDIHERMYVAREKDRLSEMLLENARFHMTLCSMARMPTLSRFIENLWLQCGPMMKAYIRTPPESQRKRHPHIDVLRALRTKDGPLAKRSIQQDIKLGSQLLLDYLESQKKVISKQEPSAPVTKANLRRTVDLLD